MAKGYVVMRQLDAGRWGYAEMGDHGDVTAYPTEAGAAARAGELGGRANGYRAAREDDAEALRQYGSCLAVESPYRRRVHG